jgi:hypothetical protein
MNNSKFFIAIVLSLAIFAAMSEIIFTFLGIYKKPSEIIPPGQMLPEELDEATVKSITERASKYLILQPAEFEEGRDPALLTPTPTPTPSEIQQ